MSRADFPRASRLLTARDFASLRGSSQRQSSRHFVVESRPGATPVARLGLAVSRRVSPHAVERNRIKRVVRESFRNVRKALPPIDVLVIAKSHAASRDNPALRADLDRIWSALRGESPGGPSAARTEQPGTCR
ncbi:MAG: ribonuclease P protein component [Lysobacterales bacterium]